MKKCYFSHRRTLLRNDFMHLKYLYQPRDMSKLVTSILTHRHNALKLHILSRLVQTTLYLIQKDMEQALFIPPNSNGVLEPTNKIKMCWQQIHKFYVDGLETLTQVLQGDKIFLVMTHTKPFIIPEQLQHITFGKLFMD